MDALADPITGRHFPNRILFFIDVTPLALLRSCGRGSVSYLDRILAAAKPFLSSPQFSSALFAFKPFFSSLSPLLSSSKLSSLYSSLHLSFLDPPQALISLTRVLVDLQDLEFASVSGFPRASQIAAGLRQVLHEYEWGTVLEDDAEGDSLVVLFSPVNWSRKQLRVLLESNGDDDNDNVKLGLVREDFCSRASDIFRSVHNVFVRKRIHVCWIDVEYEAKERTVEGMIEFAGFKEGIKRLGWGFCSSESIVLGSTIVPFGLIYPNLGLYSHHFRINDSDKRVHGSLNLEIMDASAKPLECKCCQIELIDQNIRNRNQTQLSLGQEFMNWPDTHMKREINTYLDKLGDIEVRICFLNVQKHERFAKLKEQFIEPILITECVAERGGDKDGKIPEFFADKVLDLLAKDMGEFGRKSPPLWQIILNFMYREGYWALVSLQDEDGKSKHGILKPFTFSSALIFLHDDNIADLDINKAFDTLQSGNSDSDASCGRNICKLGEAEKRRCKLHHLQNISWDDFCKEAMAGFEIKMEDEFFASKQNQSKKLKFLKCWMKQVAKAANTPPAVIIKHLQFESGDNKVNGPGESPQESEHPVSASTSAAEDSMTAASKVQDEVAVENSVESCNDFIESIPGKIRQGVELEGADLGALAERLVHSTIYCLSQKYDPELASESPSLSVATELMDLLLSDPKELSEKSKRDTANPEQEASSSAVREFELQILFRMEILRYQVVKSMKDSQQRFVKQICVLLECIQCQLEGGFFGEWCLDDYVEKIIKRRYFEVLEDVVNQIYSRMDLLLFNDKDEAPLNSEDSSYKSSRDEAGEEDVARYFGGAGSNFAEQKFCQGEDHLRRLSDARDRRERARRFKSFTSSIPDLLRVWAPRVLTSGKNRIDFVRKKGRTRETCDMVLETPLIENKRFCHRMSSPSNQHGLTSQPGASVSKALFPEDP